MKVLCNLALGLNLSQFHNILFSGQRTKKRITIYKLEHHLPGHLFSQYKALKPVKDIFLSDLNITNISFDEELIPPLGGVSP